MKRIFLILVKTAYSAALLGLFFVPLLVLATYQRMRKLEQAPGRVFIGINEIASNIHSIQNSLDSFGERTTALIYTNKFSLEGQFGQLSRNSLRMYINRNFSSSTYARFFYVFIRPLILALYFVKFMSRHDTWFFIWNHTFLPLNLDLLLLRLAKKKIIIMHCGDDVRYRPLQRAIDQSYGISSWPSDKASIGTFLSRFYFTRLSEAVGDVISFRDQATFQGKALIQFKAPMPRLNNIDSDRNKIVRILHAPSSRYVKGTAFVLEAIDMLKGRGIQFEFVLLENHPNEVVLKELMRSDILIDQPGVWAARLAMEGCSAGCCVIGGNRAEYCQQYDSPLLQFERDAKNLAAVLSDLIENPELLLDMKRKCFSFWESHYSPEAYYRYYEAIIAGDAPTFSPFPNQREILLSAASNWFEKMILWLFYHPKYSAYRD